MTPRKNKGLATLPVTDTWNSLRSSIAEVSLFTFNIVLMITPSKFLTDAYEQARREMFRYWISRIQALYTIGHPATYCNRKLRYDEIFSGELSRVAFGTGSFTEDFEEDMNTPDAHKTRMRLNLVKTIIFLLETDENILRGTMLDDYNIINHRLSQRKDNCPLKHQLPLMAFTDNVFMHKMVKNLFEHLGCPQYMPTNGTPANYTATGSFSHPGTWQRRRYCMNQKAVRSIWHPLWLQFSLMGPSWNNSAYYQRLTTHQEGAMVNDDLVEALHTQAGKIVTGQQQSFREARKQFHQARRQEAFARLQQNISAGDYRYQTENPEISITEEITVEASVNEISVQASEGGITEEHEENDIPIEEPLIINEDPAEITNIEEDITEISPPTVMDPVVAMPGPSNQLKIRVLPPEELNNMQDKLISMVSAVQETVIHVKAQDLVEIMDSKPAELPAITEEQGPGEYFEKHGKDEQDSDEEDSLSSQNEDDSDNEDPSVAGLFGEENSFEPPEQVIVPNVPSMDTTIGAKTIKLTKKNWAGAEPRDAIFRAGTAFLDNNNEQPIQINMKRNKEGNLEIVKAVNMKTGMSSTDPVNVTDEDRILMDTVHENEDGTFETIRTSKHKQGERKVNAGAIMIATRSLNKVKEMSAEGENRKYLENVRRTINHFQTSKKSRNTSLLASKLSRMMKNHKVQMVPGVKIQASHIRRQRLVVGKRSILPLQTNSIPVFPIDGADFGIVACGDTLQIGLPSAALVKRLKNSALRQDLVQNMTRLTNEIKAGEDAGILAERMSQLFISVFPLARCSRASTPDIEILF